MASAAQAFGEERFRDVRRILRPIVEEVPDFASARELNGLAMYRQGHWRMAAKELEAFRTAANGSTEQHPVLADCYRALQRYGKVEELWDELRQASPGAELVTEGRLVAAGALADQERLADAIRVLEKGWKFPKDAKEYHLRRAYSLADLYERAGDVPRARRTFEWIATRDRDFADVVERVTALS